MRPNYTQQAPTSTGLILVFLALITLIGLLLGILTHTIMTRGALTGQIQATSTAGATAAPSATATPSATSETGATATIPSATFTGHFDLSVSVSPKSVKSGEQLTITVHAFTPDTHTAISGMPCTLRAPIDGSPSLLTTFPAAQTTDTSGSASWIITAPSEPAGSYEVEAYAQTKSWSFKADSTVNLTAS